MPVPLSGPENYENVMRMREKLFIDELRRQETIKGIVDPLSDVPYDDTKTPGQSWRDSLQRDINRKSLRGIEVVPPQEEFPMEIINPDAYRPNPMEQLANYYTDGNI